MFDFNYYTPTKVVFGKNTESRVADLIKEFGGTKIIIHYGGGSVVRSGLLKRVTDTLDKAGISYVTLCNKLQHSQVAENDNHKHPLSPSRHGPGIQQRLSWVLAPTFLFFSLSLSLVFKFGCAGSRLGHARSSSLTRDRTWAPCIGSTES